MRGSTFKRCACRDEAGKQLGAACPKLTQKRHGTWYLAMTLPIVDGKRRQLKRGGFSTKADAEVELDRLRGRSSAGEHVEVRMTVGEWLTFWIDEKTKTSGASAVGKPVRASTGRGYRQHINDYLAPKLGHLLLEQIRAEHISRAYDEILVERPNMGPATLRRIHACLSSALSAAVKAQKMSRNPAPLVYLPDEDTAPVTPWTPEELGLFLDFAATHEYGVVYEFMAFTGLRRGEALGLRWSDIDLERRSLVVRQQLLQTGEFSVIKTKSGQDRVVALGEPHIAILLTHRLSQDAERATWGDAWEDGDMVFTRDGGRPLSPESVTKTFKRLTLKAGLPESHLHNLRHGTTSMLGAAGIPLEIVSKMMGHSSISFTADRYQHLFPQTATAAADAIWQLVDRTPGGTAVPTSFPQGPGKDDAPAPDSVKEQVRGGAASGTRTPNPLIKSPEDPSPDGIA